MTRDSADLSRSCADVVFIGVAGGTGSGKTTLAERICEEFGENVAVINHDSYYKAQDEKSMEERVKTNYDHPDAFDTELMCRHLDQLAVWQPVSVPVYDYSVHNRSDRTVIVQPKRVVLIEGILIFADPQLRERMMLKIFVDTDADERILRRIERDTGARGRTVESVIQQYRTTVKPMHEAFVEPSKRYADIIVPGGGENPAALAMIFSHIRHLLAQ